MASMLFLIASYVHVWKWLRWDDLKDLNPADSEQRYWMKIAAFSAAVGIFNLMNAMAFPTANAGWHVSMYLVFHRNFAEISSSVIHHIQYVSRTVNTGCRQFSRMYLDNTI